MTRRDLWQKVHDRFDPEEAAQKEWRADRKSSPVKVICEALDRPFGAPRVLLTGTIGTGKTTELLRRLAYYSGGRARDFIRSIRMLAASAWDASAGEATEALVDKVIDEARKLMETGIDRGDIALLAAVVSDPAHELPDGEKARELLSYGHLLPYPNGSEWFYPHRLLTIHKIRNPPTGPSA